MFSSPSCCKWFWPRWVVLLTIYSCIHTHQDLYLYFCLSFISYTPHYMYCESIFLLFCDTQFHIFHQQNFFFHLFAHLSCIITKTFQLVLKPGVETALNFPSLHLSHHGTQELLLFPWSSFYSPVSFTLCYVLFCHLCLFKSVYQPCLAHPQKGTSPATPVESISPEELLFHEWFLMVRHPQTFLTAFIVEPSAPLCCLVMPLPSFSEDQKASTKCYAHGNNIGTWQEENVFHVVGIAPF